MDSVLRDYCQDFISFPENVENDSSTSDIIADQGFLVWFKNKDERDSSIEAVKTAGSVRSSGR